LTAKSGNPVVRVPAATGVRIEAIDYVDNKALRRIDTLILALAASAVQTPRLLCWLTEACISLKD
jgi:hypothetical protein